jgi:hypothetical protein
VAPLAASRTIPPAGADSMVILPSEVPPSRQMAVADRAPQVRRQHKARTPNIGVGPGRLGARLKSGVEGGVGPWRLPCSRACSPTSGAGPKGRREM